MAWLAAEYDQNADAHGPLRQALKSRYAAIREAAAFELATKKDAAAFDALVGLLGTAEGPAPQRRVIAAIESLGDRRGAKAVLDRVTTDPAGTALSDDLIRAAGRFPQPRVGRHAAGDLGWGAKTTRRGVRRAPDGQRV